MKSLAHTTGTVLVALVIRDDPMIPPPKQFMSRVFNCLMSEGSSYTNGNPDHSIRFNCASVMSLMILALCPTAATHTSEEIVLPLFFEPKAMGV
jgi:hypothetical protein